MAMQGLGGPFDYTVQQPDIAGNIVGGFQAGQQIAQQQQQQQMAAQYRTDLTDYLSAPSAQKSAALIAKYPAQREAFKASWDTNSQAQKDNLFNAGTQVYSAIQNGNTNVAKDILDKQISAMKNSGQDATSFEQIRNGIDQDPKGTNAHIGLALASVDPEKWSKIATEFRTEQNAPAVASKLSADAQIAQTNAGNAPIATSLDNQAKTAQIANISSEIGTRAGQLNLDKDKLTSDVQQKLYELNQKAGTLDEGAKTLINNATIASVAADQSAAQKLDLAARIDKEGGGYGAWSNSTDFLKNATGNQNAVSDLRKEYIRLRNNEAIKTLPPGSASDADVSIAMEGFPSPSADAKTLSSFIRGMAKLSQYTAASENAKSEWVNAVGHLGKPKKDIEIDGVQVPAGTTFANFSKNYVGAKVQQRADQQAQQQVPNRSYMRFAQPGGQ